MSLDDVDLDTSSDEHSASDAALADQVEDRSGPDEGEADLATPDSAIDTVGASDTDAMGTRDVEDEPIICTANRVPVFATVMANALTLAEDASPWRPVLAAVGPDEVVAAWLDNGEEPAQLKAVRIHDGAVGPTDGVGVGVPSAIQVDGDGGPDGTLHVVWTESSERRAFYGRVGRDGSVETVLQMSPEGQLAFQPQVVGLADGSALAIWVDYSGDDFRIVETTINGSVVSDPVATGIPHNRSSGLLSPTLVAGPDDGIQLLFEDHDIGSEFTGNPDVFHTQRSGSADWEAPQNLTRTGSGWEYSSGGTLVVEESGDSHFVWVEQNTEEATNFEVYYRPGRGRTCGSRTPISDEGLTTNLNSPEMPQVRLDCDGNPRFAWMSRPDSVPLDVSELHFVGTTTLNAWVPVLYARRDMAYDWEIDGEGRHHWLWVQQGEGETPASIRYARSPSE